MKLKTILSTVALLGAFTSASYAADMTNPDVQSIRDRLVEEPGVAMEIGVPNTAYAEHFTGQSYLNPLGDGMPVANVTFVDSAHTHWHYHGTDQLLVAESGVGYVQIDGQEPVKLVPGKTFVIPPNTKHWHGAAPHHTFQHISIMKPADNMSTTWLEPVNDEDYNKLANK